MMKPHEIIDKRDVALVRAQMLREYPTEVLVTKYVNGLVLDAGGPDFSRKLRIARFLVDKALTMLPGEIDVRGAGTVLEAISEMEAAKAWVDEMCSEVLNEV